MVARPDAVFVALAGGAATSGGAGSSTAAGLRRCRGRGEHEDEGRKHAHAAPFYLCYPPRRQCPSFTKLTPNLLVASVERSLAFYVDTLGFERGMTVPERRRSCSPR